MGTVEAQGSSFPLVTKKGPHCLLLGDINGANMCHDAVGSQWRMSCFGHCQPCSGTGQGDKGHRWVAQRAMGYMGTVPIRPAGSCSKFLPFGFKISGK